jgi:hypothetical protein
VAKVTDGFLGRWSRRKLDVKEGRPVEPEPVPEAKPELPSPQPSPAGGRGSEVAPQVQAAPTLEQPPPPTLEDAHALTPGSDYTRFVKADVPADVKNAAMKKLFSDPHFNVMDGLDVYIDDYGKPDPIPESMMRQLASSRFLGLFREEEREEEREAVAKDEPQPRARDDAEGQPDESVAQSRPPADDASPAPTQAVPPESHAHPDLRLQQDDAARPGEAGRGTG